MTAGRVAIAALSAAVLVASGAGWTAQQVLADPPAEVRPAPGGEGR